MNTQENAPIKAFTLGLPVPTTPEILSKHIIQLSLKYNFQFLIYLKKGNSNSEHMIRREATYSWYM